MKVIVLSRILAAWACKPAPAVCWGIVQQTIADFLLGKSRSKQRDLPARPSLKDRQPAAGLASSHSTLWPYTMRPTAIYQSFLEAPLDHLDHKPFKET